MKFVDFMSERDRAQLRIECLKVAVELRSAQKPPSAYIATAREFEDYVTGTADTPAPGQEEQK